MTNSVENLVKTVYVYDEDGFFTDSHIAQPNPRSPGKWFFPPCSTVVRPAMEPKVFYKIRDKNSTESDWDAIPFPAGPEDFIGVEIPHQSRTQRSNILRMWLRKFVAENPTLWREKQINDEDGNLKAITIEAIPQPTAEELAEQKAQTVRSQRDRLLSQTDYLVSGDYPISDDDLATVKAYRQALRDVPAQEGFPDSVVWPELPKVTVLRD
ncbi:tail fiber assembly protein [uncultured Parasutterella sp.]|uniref:tail fiber assembly protein n=1 Tax=uncultured Parasutterella sp. TaxID=1263098 RepID=UPI002593B7E6|nr:tail fiber assembly protein [uncultured Parasutterella sp.]